MSSRAIPGRALSLAPGGECVVETDAGDRYFVARAVPGDRLAIAPEAKKAKGSRRARIVRVEARSEGWREAPCALASRCGGCPFMSAKPALQAEAKRGFLRSALTGLEASREVPVEWKPSPRELRYRRRARLVYRGARHEAGRAVGYRMRRGHALVDVASCAVLEEPLDVGLGIFREHLLPHLHGRGELLLARGTEGGVTLAIRASGPQPPELYRAMRDLAALAPVVGAELRTQEGGAPARFGDPEEHREGVDGLPMLGPPGGFSQANDAVNALLVDTVVELAEPTRASILELYAGSGNLTIPLSRAGADVHAVEIDGAAARASARNLELRGLSARQTVGDAAAAPRHPVDVVVLDPPRKGVGEAVSAVLAPKPKRIVYVSCNPRTMRSDLSQMMDAGYRMDRATGFDMFPNTPHLEAVVRLVKV